jgi:hypothetical protein
LAAPKRGEAEMKDTKFYTGLFLAGISSVLILMSSATPGALEIRPSADVTKRGEYLVRYGGCGDCHTPRIMGPEGPEPDLKRFLAGHPQDVVLPAPPEPVSGPWSIVSAGLTAWSGPWGISYAPNLTPDVDTGLGIWTEQMFMNAMRSGRHFGVGRPILPPMPWENVGVLTDDDLKAVYAYLRTIPAVENLVPDSVPRGAVAFE